MLKQAFNSILSMHSRAATMKRIGTPTLYTPIKITPSNYFRFLEGPSQTVVHGREFVIPIDSMTGHAAQSILFDDVAAEGEFTLANGDVGPIQWNASAASIQTLIRLQAGYENAVVTGSIADRLLTVTFVGIESPDYTFLSTSPSDTLKNADDEDIAISFVAARTRWTPIIKRGDKIQHDLYGSIAIDEIIEIPDLGGGTMGYRVRCE
jgi:hypothetical protein